MTCVPTSAKARAVARPMPELPPTTSTRLPFSASIMSRPPGRAGAPCLPESPDAKRRSASYITRMRRLMLGMLSLFLTLFFVPIALRAAVYFAGASTQWWTADRSSSGLLPAAARNPAAVVRVYAARTVSWRGIFAVHSWIVLKEPGASRYDRYDLTAWGDPVRLNGFEPDGRWFGQAPDAVFAADGPAAEALIPRMRAAIQGYRYRNRGDYRAWPGPNSNTFVATVMAAVPEIGAALPSIAIGKDYPIDDCIVALTPSHTGIRVSLGGYVGLTVGWVEGIEVNFLGGVVGLDIRRPGIKLPALGRIGI